MSVCPPYAPFFGFAGVTSAVGTPPLHGLEQATDAIPLHRWCLAVSIVDIYPHRFLIQICVIAVGAAYGTSKAGIGIAGLGQFKPELIMKVRMGTRYCQLSLRGS